MEKAKFYKVSYKQFKEGMSDFNLEETEIQNIYNEISLHISRT